MPKSNVHVIFEQFVSTLSALIKLKVAEAVQAATSDFFETKFGQAVTEDSKPVRRRRRRRRGVRKIVKEAVAVLGRKRGRKPGRSQRKRGTALGRRSSPKRGPKPVKLSKHGKRLGRPPKVAVTAPAAEEAKTE